MIATLPLSRDMFGELQLGDGAVVNLVRPIGETQRANARPAGASGVSWLTPAAPNACTASSMIFSAMFGAFTLIIAISALAALLPALSIRSAALRHSSRVHRSRSAPRRPAAPRCCARQIFLPNATRLCSRLHISSSASSAAPIVRMQWWMRPGPSRPCAISKPLPSPSRRLDGATRTLSSLISMCPCGASS